MAGSGPSASVGGRGFRRAFWAGLALLGLVLVYLASARPSWPWFSLWLIALLGGLAILSLPRVRQALNLSWFAVTLLVLTGTSLFDLYLFRVETHRQRSERLEIHGVYFAPDHGPIRIGVGEPDLDVRLEGSLYDFDRWSLELRRLDASRFVVERPEQVDMLRVRRPVSWRPGAGALTPALGTELSRRGDPRPSSIPLSLLPEGRRGTLAWGDSRASLALDDRLLDRRLSRSLSNGVKLAELDWDQPPLSASFDDLVLTRTKRGRSLGRLQLTLPEYRVTSRAGAAGGVNGEPTILETGDTLWVTSRGKRWAFAIDRVPGVSRVAAPIAVMFVRRPRRTGWALPSPEACGSAADRCAVISTRRLPPPQPHFDLSAFGLDTARYSILARLETDRSGVRVVGAQSAASFPYGVVHPLAALSRSGEETSTGILLRVNRDAQGRQIAVLLTVLALYFMIIGALLVVSGDARLWRKRRSTSPHIAAAWGFLNVFLIFLGVRLALGLRVAYTPPFYDRAAATAVGLWITFAVLLVALGRWSSWAPRFWSLVSRIEKPVSRLFLPGVNGTSLSGTESEPSPVAPSSDASPFDPEELRRGRRRTLVGLIVWLPALGFLLWQRPATAASLVVSVVALGAWLAMGLSRTGAAHAMGEAPLNVITATGGNENPSMSFAIAAGLSVVLVLAIHAPELALAPVLVLLFLFAVNYLLGWSRAFKAPERRAWALYVVIGSLAALGVAAFAPWPRVSAGVLALMALGGAWYLGRRVQEGGASRIAIYHQSFMELGRSVFGGVGWVGALLVLGVLVFLNFQAIPPFVRFALVFMLFLLAIRAGLACRRVLDAGGPRGRFEALGILVIPIGVLLVFMLFDFGLGLVFFVPMFVTVLLSARIDRLPASLALSSVCVLGVVLVVAWSVLNPSLDQLRASPDVPTFATEYPSVGNGLTDVLRRAGLSGPITRATVRSMAASDPKLLEEALVFAGPSEALFAAAPSREQVWGGMAYASSGWTGTGFAGTTLLGRGVPTSVSYAENTFSVYVLSEHGALGGISVLMLYLALLVVVGIWITRVHTTIQDSATGIAVLAITVGGVLWLTIPAVYVAASNLAMVPLTGQNMPFLGLNSWADVVLVSGLATGIVLALATLDEPAAVGAAGETGGAA